MNHKLVRRVIQPILITPSKHLFCLILKMSMKMSPTTYSRHIFELKIGAVITNSWLEYSSDPTVTSAGCYTTPGYCKEGVPEHQKCNPIIFGNHQLMKLYFIKLGWESWRSLGYNRKVNRRPLENFVTDDPRKCNISRKFQSCDLWCARYTPSKCQEGHTRFATLS